MTFALIFSKLKCFQNQPVMRSIKIIRFLALNALVLIFLACKSDKKEAPDLDVKLNEASLSKVIEVVTNAMEFQLRDSIKSGWNTFKYINNSPEAHFILFDKYPEGKSIEDAHNEVMPAFDKGMELIIEGKMDAAMDAFGKLPEWFGDIVFSGGSGLISPNQSNLFTIKLDPGYYILECYVKMADGKFHSSMGMTKELIVLNEDSGNKPPSKSVKITLSSTEGMVVEGEFKKGKNIVGINNKDQIVYENFVGHDVNLVKLDAGADMEALEAWMNWASPTGLMTPFPDGVTFLGGVNDAPAGSIQYFEVDLDEGDYVLISEIPNASDKGMLKTFKITD